MSDRDSPLGEGVHVLRAVLTELQAAREVVEAARELCLGMLDMGLHGEANIELFEALEAAVDRYDAVRGA